MSAKLIKVRVIDCYELQEQAVYKGWYVESYVPGCPTTFVRACVVELDSEIQFEVPNDTPNEPISFDQLKYDLAFNLNVLIARRGFSSCEVEISPWKE